MSHLTTSILGHLIWQKTQTFKIKVGTDIIYSLIGDQSLYRTVLSNWHYAISGQLKGSALAVQE